MQQGLTKRQLRELRRITENIPADLLKNLMKKEMIAPTMRKVLELALEEPESVVSEEQKERFRNLIASGMLDREVESLDHDKEALIDAYLSAEIALAVKAGRLPKNAPQLEITRKKGKQYARRQSRRVKDLYDSAQDHEAGPRADGTEHAGADSSLGSDARAHDRANERGA